MRLEAGETTHAAAAEANKNIPPRKASDAELVLGVAPGGYVKRRAWPNSTIVQRLVLGSIKNMQRTWTDSHFKKSREGLLFQDPNNTKNTEGRSSADTHDKENPEATPNLFTECKMESRLTIE